MSTHDPKRVVFAGLAQVAKALGHVHRLEILEYLAQGERSVEAVAERAGLSVANASQHLRLMQRSGLLASRREGKRVLYRVRASSVIDLAATLGRVAEENVAAVREVVGGYFRDRDSLEPVSREELRRRLKEGTVTVLDVRPHDEYRAGHLPTAVNIPLRELSRRLRELPRRREVVAYCRGPYCVLAVEAVDMLRAQGFTAYRLEDGVPDWQARGYPIAVGEDR